MEWLPVDYYPSSQEGIKYLPYYKVGAIAPTGSAKRGNKRKMKKGIMRCIYRACRP